MTNRLRGFALSAAALVAVGGGWLVPIAAHADVATYSYVTALTDSSYAGRGVGDTWAPGNGTISVSGDTNSVTVTAMPKYGATSQLSFAAPPGQTLAVGTYPETQNAWYGCTATGTFVVSDVHFSGANVVDRLRLHYRQQCPGSSAEQIGDVVVNEAPADSTVLTVPEAVTFTPTYAGKTSTMAPVWLDNEQPTPLTVSAAAITGADAAKFQIVTDSCTQAPIPSGGSCVATLSFAPGQDSASAAAALTFTDDSVIGSHTVPLTATVRPGHTSWDLVGDAADTLLGPHYIQGTPSTMGFDAGGTSNSVSTRITTKTPYGSDVTYVTTFTMPTGQSLAVGDYPSATTAGSTSGPGLSFGNPYPCGSETGSFHIDEITFDPDSGLLTALAVSFVAHCGTDVAAAYGSIAWQATDPAPERAGPGSPTDTVAPGAPSVVPDKGVLSSVHLSWSNPADADFDRTIVREAVGTTPPARLVSGVGVYTGRNSTVTITGLKPGLSYSYTLWSVDSRGNLSTPTHYIMHGTVTLLSVPIAPYGANALAAGAVVDVVTGRLLQGEMVQFSARAPGSSTWCCAQSRIASGDVAYRVFVLKSPIYVRDSFSGGFGVMYSVGPTALMRVAPNVSAYYTGDIKRGGTERITGTISPNLAGHRIYLQRRYSGAWHSFKSMLLTSRSGFGFAFPLTTTGVYTFRLYMSAVGNLSPLVTSSILVGVH
jgi:hypothetical protein